MAVSYPVHSLLSPVIIFRADVCISGEITLCVYERADIPKDSAFPTYDLAYKYYLRPAPNCSRSSS
jgi:hypothetical protein